MPILSSTQAEPEAILAVAKMIMAAVTTSPKGRGVSTVTSVLIHGEEKERLAKAMEEQFPEERLPDRIFQAGCPKYPSFRSRAAHRRQGDYAQKTGDFPSTAEPAGILPVRR